MEEGRGARIIGGRASLISARVVLVGGPMCIQVGLEEWPSSRASWILFVFSSLFFYFYLLPTSRHSRCSCDALLLRRRRWDARARTGSRTEKRSGTNLSDIGKNRANPRATRRWTTWKHVASEIVVGREEKRRTSWTRPKRSRDLVFSEPGEPTRTLQSVSARSIFRNRLGRTHFVARRPRRLRPR